MTTPSERVHDVFRRRNYGKVDAPDNTKPATDNFHIDQSRLGVHEEYDAEAPNDWGGTGKFVSVPNDIRTNAVAHMGDLRGKSSYRDLNAPTSDTGTGPCCVPSSYAPYGKNPMYKTRKGE